MLTEEEKRDIQALLEHEEHPRAAGLEALKVVQRYRGWVPDESILDVAPLLEMTPAELDSIATFYDMIWRRPVGRHVILICDSVTCWVMGYEHVREHLLERLGVALGETTADGRFTLLPVNCLGACHRAPAMMVDEDLHVELDEARIDEILGRYL